MASIIDEYKMYLNTPKKIVIFRFSVSLVFFLLGLSMSHEYVYSLKTK